MTMIYNVHTDRSQGCTLTGSIQYIDPYHYGFSHDPVFGLQLIMDGWEMRGDFGAGDVSEATAAEFSELFELYLGGKAWVDEEGYLLEDGSTEVRIPRVKAEDFYRGQLSSGSGSSGGVRYLCLKPKPDEFRRRTAEIIVNFELTEDPPDDEPPAADFTVEVSDPRYLEHFSTKGAYFQTTFNGMLSDE